MKRFIVVLFILVVFVFSGLDTPTSLSAQEVKFPRVSQKAVVSQTIGLTEVVITFHRPGVKGRVIWGELVPFEKVWRAGANEATTISFSSGVKIEGNELPAGTYGFFYIPHEDGSATLIFSKQADIWGSYAYKEEMDALRIKVQTQQAEFCEWLMYCFTDLTDSSANACLRWEKVKAAFKIEVDTQGMILKSAEKTFDKYWSTPNQAATYAFDRGLDNEARKWVELSTKIEENYWNMQLKAKIYKKMARTKKDHRNAIKIMEKAIMLGKKLRPDQQENYVTHSKELLNEWKTKK